MKHILLIDDDLPIGNMMEEVLSKAGYQISRAYSGTEAVLLLSASALRPDLILLDLMLPGLSGEDVLRKIKGIPVIVVSAKVDVDSKVNLLLGGAADYITKPFATKELLARIAVALRNAAPQSNDILSYADLRLDPLLQEVSVGKAIVKLTRTECAILKNLMHNPTQVLAKSVLLDRISLDTPDCTDQSLKTHISNLRRKLREVSGVDYIESVWGIGFKLKAAQY
jgi:DNA-binding response OmpR family regulator